MMMDILYDCSSNCDLILPSLHYSMTCVVHLMRPPPLRVIVNAQFLFASMQHEDFTEAINVVAAKKKGSLDYYA